MNEIIVLAKPKIEWLPECFFDLFYEEVMENYFHVANHDDIIPSVIDVMEYFSNTLLLQIASYNNTDGKDTGYFDKYIAEFPISERKGAMYTIIGDLEDELFKGINLFLTHYHIAHCHTTEPEYIREFVLTHAVEVW
ncbi:hypothetical protein AAXE64_27355 [Priestia megaterium]|uniref:hypothetical protein n=1 Tax=Priestia megaterium TaxID=1404 RepID=UPI003D06AD3F